MIAAFQIAFKEFKLLFRSKRRIVWLFSTTLIIIGISLLAGLVVLFVEEEDPKLFITGDLEDFEDNNSGIVLKNLCDFYTNENFTIISPEEANTRIKDKSFDILVQLSQNFSSVLLDNSTSVNATVKIYYDAGDLTSIKIASEVELAVQHLNAAIIFEVFNIEKSLWVAPELENIAEGAGEFGAAMLAMIPLYVMLLMALPAVSLTLISVTIEREQKTLEPLLLSRISRNSIVWGKLLYGILLIGISLGLNLISMLVGFVFFILLTGNNFKTSDLSKIFREISEFTDLSIFDFLFLFLGLILLSMLLVAVCVLFSFIAKDEREGQMLNSSVIGIPSILVLTFIFLPFGDFPFWLKFFLALIPLFGFLQSGFLIFLETKIGLIAIIGLLSQFGWLVLTIWATTRLMESEGILEVSLSQIFSKRNLFTKIKG